MFSQERKIEQGRYDPGFLGDQSLDVDISETVLKLIYARVESKVGLFHSEGVRFPRYRFTALKRDIIAADQSTEAQVMGKLCEIGGSSLSLDKIATSSGCNRLDLIRKLEEWSDLGTIGVHGKELQHLFRLERSLPPIAEQIKTTVNELDHYMEERERQAVECVDVLVKLFSRALSEYFGKTDEGVPDECGHCMWCETHEMIKLEVEPSMKPNMRDAKWVALNVAESNDPRMLTKNRI